MSGVFLVIFCVITKS
jgi:hypothetical protein